MLDDLPEEHSRDLLGPPPPEQAPSPAPPEPLPEADLLTLLARSRQPLMSLFRNHHIGPDEAEDIAQEALLVVVQRWHEIAYPLPFLLGTVRHCIQLHFQRQRGERAALAELASREAAAAADVPQRRIDAREDARRFLARLSERARPVVALRYGAGLPSSEIARHLDRSEPGVRQAASRGLRRLRRYVKAIRSSF
jgi:RNA polymerase sigma factor (sigma-70 family)